MKKFIVFVVCLSPVLAIGAEVPTDFFKEHSSLFQWVLGGALLMNGLFLNRTLGNIDKLWKKHNDINERLSHLEGEHIATHGERK